MRRIRIDEDGWCRCGKCGHKLFRTTTPEEVMQVSIEIKCHSCKEINVVQENKERSEG